MRVTSFGSGSSGNAFLIEAGGTRLLLDAGLPVTILRDGLASRRVAPDDLDAVLLSHEHHDHVRGLERLLSSRSTPCFATAGTIAAIGQRGAAREWRVVRPDERVTLGAVEVTPIAVPHDADEPVGYVVEHDRRKVAIFTDLGEPTAALADPLRGAHLIVLEANYDPSMLARGTYPPHLKRRVAGPRGHLSNGDCAATLARHIDGVTTEVWLAHLSANNNRPAVALAAVSAELGAGPVAPRLVALPRRGKPVTWDSVEAMERPRQSALPLF